MEMLSRECTRERISVGIKQRIENVVLTYRRSSGCDENPWEILSVATLFDMMQIMKLF
jgi:hypothetical protein